VLEEATEPDKLVRQIENIIEKGGEEAVTAPSNVDTKITPPNA
jgi:hypothetical protein